MASKNFGEYCLRWTNHESLIQGACQSLLASEKFADVTLFCEGKSLPCHKFILSACSTYFDRIFSESPFCPNPVIILRDVSHHQMQSLLYFIYCGEMTAEESELESLIELAQSLCIKGIGEIPEAINARSKPVVSITPETAAAVTRKRLDKPIPKKLIKKLPKRQVKAAVATPSPMVTIINPEENQLEEETSLEPLIPISESVDDELVADDSEYIIPDTEIPNGQIETEQSIGENSLLDPEEARPQNRTAPKRGRHVSGPVIRSVRGNAFTSYKRYSQENLVAAIRAVTEEGMKKAEACVTFGIPFTTLTRKMTRICKTPNNQLPKAKKKLRKIAPKTSSGAVVNNIIAMTNSNIVKEASLTEYRPSRVETSLNVEILQEPQSIITNGSSTVFKQCKTYTEENLQEAISAVLSKDMKIGDACSHYGIPRTTLARKLHQYSKETESTP